MGGKKKDGPWSDWRFNKKRGVYISSRVNKHGDKERQMYKPHVPPQDGEPQTIPRQPDDVADSLSGLSLSTEGQEPEGEEVAAQAEHMPLPSSSGTSSLQLSTRNFATSSAPLSSPQGQGNDYYSGNDTTQYNSTASNVSLPNGYNSIHRNDQIPANTGYSSTLYAANNVSGDTMVQPNGYNQIPTSTGYSSAGYAANSVSGNAMIQPNGYNSNYGRGQSPANTEYSSINYGSIITSGNAMPQSYDNTPQHINFSPGGQIPTAPASNSYRGRGGRTNGQGGRTNEFKVCDSSFFKHGYVFKVLWSEPRGSQNRDDDGEGYSAMKSWLTRTQYIGETPYTSIRRFVICKAYNGHALCLPILTYSKRGSDKPGIKPEHHAIIYTELNQANRSRNHRQTPQVSEGETPLPNTPIRVEPNAARHQLNMWSRLNYAKVYTIEHNVKVCFVGRIHKNSMGEFDATYARIQHQQDNESLPVTIVGPIQEDDEGFMAEETEEENIHPDNTKYIHPDNRKFKYK
ncbi:hypothetical protein V495_03558 [Pseudogymnoascus sp. VKM F-4514 (FW-929)]|nr:hypothetical protein V495_03558 [Pseudogymnoascus sp. VKM F-4514 (FW-929)]KFY57862.1 hypothetical protein V497_05266 [Pseudogymnoascus sp. VKM F-4516 (FW-969)]